MLCGTLVLDTAAAGTTEVNYLNLSVICLSHHATTPPVCGRFASSKWEQCHVHSWRRNQEAEDTLVSAGSNQGVEGCKLVTSLWWGDLRFVTKCDRGGWWVQFYPKLHDVIYENPNISYVISIYFVIFVGNLELPWSPSAEILQTFLVICSCSSNRNSAMPVSLRLPTQLQQNPNISNFWLHYNTLVCKQCQRYMCIVQVWASGWFIETLILYVQFLDPYYRSSVIQGHCFCVWSLLHSGCIDYVCNNIPVIRLVLYIFVHVY